MEPVDGDLGGGDGGRAPRDLEVLPAGPGLLPPRRCLSKGGSSVSLPSAGWQNWQFVGRRRTWTEEKRAKLAEAAERRQKEAASRGILNVQSVEEKRKKKEKIEREMAASVPPPEGGLRWTVS